MATLINNERYAKYYHKLGAVYQRPEIKASLEVIFSVFMVSLLILLAIRPTLTNLAALQKKIVDNESISVKADKKIAQLFSVQEQLDSNSGFLALYDSAVPEIFSYLDMVGRMETLAKNNGVDLESTSVPGTSLLGDTKATGEWASKIIKKDNNNMMVITIDFSLSGKPNQIKSFLVGLENMDRVGVIKNINLVRESSSIKGSEKVKASGQINFYVLKLNK